MNLQTHIQFGNLDKGLFQKEYLVVNSAIHFFRSDNGFHPDSSVKCDSLDITVVAPHKSDLLIQEWFFSNAPLNGRLLFELTGISSSQESTVVRTLEFNGARCYSFSERYDIERKSLRLFDLQIKVERCVIDNINFDNGSF